MSVGLVRKAVAACAVLGVLLTTAACTRLDQAAGTDGVQVGTSQPGSVTNSAAPITVAPLPVDGDKSPAASSVPSVTETTSSSSAPQFPPATVTGSPALNSTDVAPGEPIVLTSLGGTLESVSFAKEDGSEVPGELSADRTGWTTSTKLGFGHTYTVSGTAVNVDGLRTPITGTYTTATTTDPVNVSISPRNGAEVGIAAPIIVSLGYRPDDLALIEKNVSVVTDPPVEGAWAWIQHAGYTYPSLDWRPEKYWPAGTKVHVEANLYGLKFADKWYGGEDVAVDFVIGRNQIVKADAKTNSVTVLRDGKLFAKYNGSFGKGDKTGDPNLVTRSGIHVVTSKHEVYHMSNPAYGYTDAKEFWAVRISNNGEFLHNNPGTSAWQLANSHVTHGCINMSWKDAKAYFESAMYGDPVEITGTSMQLSRKDGDIYDWTIPWAEWKTLSALSPDSTVVGN
ncbi:MAG: Ig-like domain-containing protein [Nakamurella sp.]